MLSSIESSPLVFATKPTWATNGSVTWIFDQQLQLHPLKGLQAVPRGLVGASAEGLINDDEPETAASAGVPARRLTGAQAELEGQRGTMLSNATV